MRTHAILSQTVQLHQDGWVSEASGSNSHNLERGVTRETLELRLRALGGHAHAVSSASSRPVRPAGFHLSGKYGSFLSETRRNVQPPATTSYSKQDIRGKTYCMLHYCCRCHSSRSQWQRFSSMSTVMSSSALQSAVGSMQAKSVHPAHRLSKYEEKSGFSIISQVHSQQSLPSYPERVRKKKNGQQRKSNQSNREQRNYTKNTLAPK